MSRPICRHVSGRRQWLRQYALTTVPALRQDAFTGSQGIASGAPANEKAIAEFRLVLGENAAWPSAETNEASQAKANRRLFTTRSSQ